MSYKLSQNLGRPGFHSEYSEVCKACYFIKAALEETSGVRKLISLVGLVDGLSLFPGHRINDEG